MVTPKILALKFSPSLIIMSIVTLQSCDSYPLRRSITSNAFLLEGKPFVQQPEFQVESHYYEAPARMEYPLFVSRERALSFSEVIERKTCFIRLESEPHSPGMRDLYSLVQRADNGMNNGVEPILADGALGGTYFLRDRNRAICVVCKPGDEEPNSPNNPYQDGDITMPWGLSFRGRIIPGFGMYREVAGYLLDKGFAGVPPTSLARARLATVVDLRKRDQMSEIPWVPGFGYKICSVQSYVRHECSTEDMGPSMFDKLDAQRIATMDIRLGNLDRHEGNILVCLNQPFQICKSVNSDSPSKRNSHVSMTSESVALGNRVYNHDVDDLPHPLCSSAPASSPRFVKYFESECSSSAAGSAKSEPGTSYRLVPIDHGYTLPHVLHLSDSINLAWLGWPQMKEPIAPDIRRYIENLRVEEDVAMLKHNLGAAIPETSLLTLRVGTAFLQKGSAAGLTLFDMGEAMVPRDDDIDVVKPRKVNISCLQKVMVYCHFETSLR